VREHLCHIVTYTSWVESRTHARLTTCHDAGSRTCEQLWCSIDEFIRKFCPVPSFSPGVGCSMCIDKSGLTAFSDGQSFGHSGQR
jgi:hypothetical protein